MPPHAVVPNFTLNNGVQVPVIGLGVFQTPPTATVDAVLAALAAGYRHIDTAAAYGNEREVGAAIRGSGIPRAQVFIETKLWVSDYGYDAALHAFADATVVEIGRRHGTTPAQVMLRWHIQHGRQVIPKSTRPERISENFDIFDFALAGAELAAIDALDTGRRSGPDPDQPQPRFLQLVIPEA